MSEYGKNEGRIGRLTPGAVLSTENGDSYIYLGYYEGSARTPSSNKTVDRGYLYVNVWTPMSAHFNAPNVPNCEYIHGENGLLARLAPKMFEYGYASYTKRPKKFAKIEKVVDLAPVWDRIQTAYGLLRVRDK